MMRAVFLDRDGTINEEMGYINHLSRFRLLPGSAEAIARLNQAGLKVVVATNQSGVARKYFPASLIGQVHDLMLELLAQQQRPAGCHLYLPACSRWRTAPAANPGRVCCTRRPRNWHLDLSRSYVVGDRYNDLHLAAKVGAKGILVLTGYGRGELENYQGERLVEPDYIAADLLDAAAWILKDVAATGGL